MLQQEFDLYERNVSRYVIKFNTEKHSINAETLAEALVAYSSVVKSFADGCRDTDSVAVDVEVVEQGCIEIHTIITALQSVFNPDTINGIFDCVRNLVDLYKFLKGEPAKKVESQPSGNEVTITNAQNNKITITQNVYNVYGNAKIPPFGDAQRYDQDKITSVQLIDENGVEKVKIDKSEFESFYKGKHKVDDDELKDEHQTLELVVETIPIGSPKKMWGFVLAGESVRAKIKDDSFIERIERHEITFGQGDRIVADVRIHKEFDPALNCVVVKSRTIEHVAKTFKLS